MLKVYTYSLYNDNTRKCFNKQDMFLNHARTPSGNKVHIRQNLNVIYFDPAPLQESCDVSLFAELKVWLMHHRLNCI